jgi:hypothetical protein
MWINNKCINHGKPIIRHETNHLIIFWEYGYKRDMLWMQPIWYGFKSENEAFDLCNVMFMGRWWLRVYVSCVYQKTRRIELLNVVGFYIVSRSDWIKQNGSIWTSPKHLATPRQSGPIWILPNSVLRHLAGPGPQTIALIEAWLVHYEKCDCGSEL